MRPKASASGKQVSGRHMGNKWETSLRSKASAHGKQAGDIWETNGEQVGHHAFQGISNGKQVGDKWETNGRHVRHHAFQGTTTWETNGFRDTPSRGKV